MHNFAEGRAIGARKDVLADPAIVDARAVPLTDTVQQRRAVRLQAARDGVKEGTIVEDPDMLEHADRYDPVEAPDRCPIIQQLK